MGEAAEDALNGLCCEQCGQWFDDILNGAEEPGYPRRCENCGPIVPRFIPRKNGHPEAPKRSKRVKGRL